MTKTKNVVRYIVRHSYRLNKKSEAITVEVSYSNSLSGDLPYSALSLAKHTASRYFGEIYERSNDGTETMVKSYSRKTLVE